MEQSTLWAEKYLFSILENIKFEIIQDLQSILLQAFSQKVESEEREEVAQIDWKKHFQSKRFHRVFLHDKARGAEKSTKSIKHAERRQNSKTNTGTMI